MRDSARLLVLTLIGLILLAMGPLGCAPVASVEPADATEGRVFEPALLGRWVEPSGLMLIYLQVSQARGKYRVVATGLTLRAGRPWLDAFDAELIRLKDHLFLSVLHQDELTGGDGLGFALVTQLSPAPVIAFIDEDYLEEHPPPTPRVDGPTEELQRFLLTALEHGAFGKEEWSTVKFAASKATALHFAAAQGRRKEVKKLIRAGADVNAKAEEDWTPLHWAVIFGAAPSIPTFGGRTVDTIELLLAKGADVNAKGEGGWTPLHAGASLGSVDVVKLLLASGADVNAKTEQGHTPLHRGAHSGSAGVVELLLAHGAEVNAKAEKGWTALHSAVQVRSIGVVELLLAKGADVNAQSFVGTPLDYASDPEILKLLKQHASKR